MKAKTIKGRVEQCRHWLADNYPPHVPVTVKWLKRLGGLDKKELESHQITPRDWKYGIHGWCQKQGGRFVIALSTTRNRSRQDACEILMHEWSHALTEKFAKLENTRLSTHDDEFFLVWGRIYRRWNENGGAEEADKYEY